MVDPTSTADIDLSPIPGKSYTTMQREWREDFIYFLMVDRFSDGTLRSPTLTPGRSQGVATPEDFYGGTLRGVTANLDYIAGLGATAVWLSPVLENNAGAYHGYNTASYLSIDPHFGVKQDLIDLVDAAHARQMRVILDVVINHSGDNWYYPGDIPWYYSGDQRFPFGAWRRPDRPIPTELRDPDLYHRRGQITADGWDSYPEAQHGDIVTLKDYANDDDDFGSRLINALITSYCYWIREADVDGFRVDAVKHMGELACSRFCSAIREYAHSLGKHDFFLFGEAATASDEIYDRYIGPNTSRSDAQTVYFGLDSLLDFRLAQGTGSYGALWAVLKGLAEPKSLFDRLDAQRNRALNRGELGRYLVTFVDNHDSFWQSGRVAAGATDEQVIGCIGYLLCALGTPCVYYGTEQGFSGSGGDNAMREAMFDRDSPGVDLLNTDCSIYQGIAQIGAVVRDVPALRFGRMYYRQISADAANFGLPYGADYTLAFSRLLYPHEVLIAYNVSGARREDCVVVDSAYHPRGSILTFRYGGVGSLAVERAVDGTHYVKLPLDGHQFVILT